MKIELKDTLIEKNFTCQAAIAAVAEHSIMHQFATGRPDQNDLTVLSDFVRKIKEKDNNSIKSDLLPVHVPGNRPYREYGTIPPNRKPVYPEFLPEVYKKQGVKYGRYEHEAVKFRMRPE